MATYQKPGDKAWEEIPYPVAHRMLEKCDAVLRLEGASKKERMKMCAKRWSGFNQLHAGDIAVKIDGYRLYCLRIAGKAAWKSEQKDKKLSHHQEMNLSLNFRFYKF